MKFEEAYCATYMETYSVDFISDIFAKSPDIFSKNYQGNLYCPECHKAQLSFKNAQSPYFSAYPKAPHEPDCTLKQNTMSVKQSKKFISEEKNKDKIQRQMQSVMLRLFSVVAKPRQPKVYVSTSKSTVTTSTIALPKTETNQLQQKRIDLAFRPGDFGCYKLFYGKVIARWEFDEKTKHHKILMYHPKKKQMLCRVTVTEVAYKYVAYSNKFDKAILGNVVFLANFEEPTGTSYQRAVLERGEYLSFIADEASKI